MRNMITKPFVFVLMPFSDKFDDIYELGIKAACREAGAYCERVDEQFFDDTILERIYNQIAKADIVVADLTGRNPNVFYETGYAHALGKRVISLTQSIEDIPFDLTQYSHISYEGKISFLKEQLEKRIRWCIDHPKDSLSDAEFNLELYVSGTLLQKDKKNKVKCLRRTVRLPNKTAKFIKFQLDVHNPMIMIYKQYLTIGLVLRKELRENKSDIKVVPLPDGSYMHQVEIDLTLLPKSWDSIPIKIIAPDSLSSDSIDGLLRVFTEIGILEYPLEITK